MVYVYSRPINETNRAYRVSMRGKNFFYEPPSNVEDPAVDAIEMAALELGFEVKSVIKVPGHGCYEVALEPLL